MCVYEHKWLSLEYKASDLLSYLMGEGGSQDFHKEFTEIAFLKDKKENKPTTAFYFTNRNNQEIKECI